jgi:hypothetical protein
MNYKIQRFGDQLHLHHQGYLMMGMELVFETLYFIIYLKRMSASAHFIEKDTGS